VALKLAAYIDLIGSDRVTPKVLGIHRNLAGLQHKNLRNLNVVGQKFKNVANIAGGVLAARAVSSSIAAVSSGLREVVDQSVQFDEAVTRAGAKFEKKVIAGTPEFMRMEEATRQVGATTEHTMLQSAKAVEEYAKANIDLESTMAMLPGSAQLATNANVEMAEAVGISLGVFDSWSMRSKDAAVNQARLANVNDILTKTATSARMEITDLDEAVQYSGSVAAGAGMQFQDYAAMVGLLARANIRGTKAGTAMKNMMTKLFAPKGRGAKWIKELGLKTVDEATGKLRDPLEVIKDFRAKYNEMGQAKGFKATADIMGLRALPGFLAIARMSQKNFDDYVASIRDHNGAAQEMTTIIRGSLGNQVKVLKSQMISLGIATFNAFKPELLELLKDMKDLLKDITPKDVVDGIREFASAVKTTYKFVKALVPWFILYVTWLTAYKVIMTAIVAMKAIWYFIKLAKALGSVRLALMAVGATPIVLAISGVIAAVVMLILYWDEVIQKVREFVRWMNKLSGKEAKGATRTGAHIPDMGVGAAGKTKAGMRDLIKKGKGPQTGPDVFTGDDYATTLLAEKNKLAAIRARQVGADGGISRWDGRMAEYDPSKTAESAPNANDIAARVSQQLDVQGLIKLQVPEGVDVEAELKNSGINFAPEKVGKQ
jgi:TP901 family phage tail tape measure protein